MPHTGMVTEKEKNAVDESMLRERGGGVSVSLIPMVDGNKFQELSYPADLLRVDKVALEDRAPTGLSGGSQGDHTIADAFIKQYQKNIVQGELLSDVFAIYKHWADSLNIDNEAAIYEDWAKRHEITVGDDTKRRFDVAKQLARRASVLAQTGVMCASSRNPVHFWRIAAKEMIADFNGAYAHSLWSTQGKGTGGRGEKAGMEAVKGWERESGGGSLLERMGKMSYLLDMSSVGKLPPGNMEFDISVKDLDGAIDSFSAAFNSTSDSVKLNRQILLAELTALKNSGSPMGPGVIRLKNVPVVVFRFLKMLGSMGKNAWNAHKRESRQSIRKFVQERVDALTGGAGTARGPAPGDGKER